MANKYNRILLKLSGESLMGQLQYGLDPAMLEQYALEVKTAIDMGVQVAVVIGGGNIFRGMSADKTGISRAQGDYMGMLATVINGVALQSIFEKHGMQTRLVTALEIKEVAEPYIQRRSIRHLEKGRVVIFGGGTGNPFFTTDTAAALRAVEINADVILKGTRVDGIYTSDPEKDRSAKRYERISYREVIENRLNVMDMTAFTLCQENGKPIIVFDMNKTGNLKKLLGGEQIGTLVHD